MRVAVHELTYGYVPGQPVISRYSKTFGGGVTLLKGYSGCGKSTLLKLLAGPAFLTPQSGGVALDGRTMSAEDSRRHVGFVFQQLNLLPLASIGRNIAMSGLLAGVPSREVKLRTRAILAEVGLADFEHRSPETLSGGQQQRAAIARALVKQPAILLLDEPTSGLDDTNTDLILNILRRIAPTTTCIISTHDARLIPVADEVIHFPLTPEAGA